MGYTVVALKDKLLEMYPSWSATRSRRTCRLTSRRTHMCSGSQGRARVTTIWSGRTRTTACGNQVLLLHRGRAIHGRISRSAMVTGGRLSKQTVRGSRACRLLRARPRQRSRARAWTDEPMNMTKEEPVPLKPFSETTALLAGAAAPGPSSAIAAGQPGVEQRAADTESRVDAPCRHRKVEDSQRGDQRDLFPSGAAAALSGAARTGAALPHWSWNKLESEQRRVSAWYDGSVFTLLDSGKAAPARYVPRAGNRLFKDMAARLGFRAPLSVLLREDSPSLLPELVYILVYRRDGLDGDPYHRRSSSRMSTSSFLAVAEGAPVAQAGRDRPRQ